MDLAWRASAARRRTSPFSVEKSSQTKIQRDFWRFQRKVWRTSGHIKVSKSPNRFEKKNSSLELYFPPKAWRRVVGVGVSSSDGMTSELQSFGGNTHWNNSRTVFCFKIWRIFTWIYCFLCFLSFLICFVCFWVAFWTFFWSLKQTIFFVEKRNVKKRVWRALSTKASWTTAVSLFFTLDHAANRRPHTMHTQTSESKVCKVSTSSCQKSRQLSSQCSVNAQSSQLSSSHGTKGMQKRCTRQWVTNTQRWQFGTTKKIWWKWHQGEGKERWSESYIAVVQKLWNVVFCICDILCMRLHQIPLMFLQNPSKMFGIHNSSLICCMNPPVLYESHPWSCTTLIPYKTQINRTGAKPFLRILSHSRPQT